MCTPFTSAYARTGSVAAAGTGRCAQAKTATAVIGIVMTARLASSPIRGRRSSPAMRALCHATWQTSLEKKYVRPGKPLSVLASEEKHPPVSFFSAATGRRASGRSFSGIAGFGDVQHIPRWVAITVARAMVPDDEPLRYLPHGRVGARPSEEEDMTYRWVMASIALGIAGCGSDYPAISNLVIQPAFIPAAELEQTVSLSVTFSFNASQADVAIVHV